MRVVRELRAGSVAATPIRFQQSVDSAIFRIRHRSRDPLASSAPPRFLPLQPARQQLGAGCDRPAASAAARDGRAPPMVRVEIERLAITVGRGGRVAGRVADEAEQDEAVGRRADMSRICGSAAHAPPRRGAGYRRDAATSSMVAGLALPAGAIGGARRRARAAFAAAGCGRAPASAEPASGAARASAFGSAGVREALRKAKAIGIRSRSEAVGGEQAGFRMADEQHPVGAQQAPEQAAARGPASGGSK